MTKSSMPKYAASLLDQFLEDTDPDYSSLGLKSPKSMGDQLKALSADEADTSFLDNISGPSRHQTALGMMAGYTPRQLNKSLDESNDSILGEVVQTFQKAENTDYEKKGLNDKEIESRLKLLLNLGYSHEKIASFLQKSAEVKVFDTSQSLGTFIKDYAPGLGLAYIEPNFFMKSCDQSFAKIQKEGKLRAIAVKKITACDGCASYKNGSCAVYRKPVVASGEELTNVVRAELASKNIKAASLKEGLAKLQANEKVATAVITSTQNTGTVRTAGDMMVKVKKEASIQEIGTAIQSGIPVQKVFKEASAQYGKVSALNAVKRYIASLKSAKAKVAIASIDCSYLKGKLASTNAIIGESKCASCSYRNAMHCGLTGGTLLSFPGMNRTSSKRIANENEADGHKVLFEYEMLDTNEDVPLTINEDRTDLGVELHTTSKIDID